ncbi:hypothetical protein J4430_00400 [Candidatus Woesearchaeota archaeon]|nr:hypothetical protein [Candidatus Woesearchaeota archaeon]
MSRRIPDYCKITPSLRVIEAFREFPQNDRDKRRLLLVYGYPKLHGRPIEKLPDTQIHEVSLRVYKDCVETLGGFSFDKFGIIRKIYDEMLPLNNNNHSRLEAAAERIAIQIEGCGLADDRRVTDYYDLVLHGRPLEEKTIAYSA